MNQQEADQQIIDWVSRHATVVSAVHRWVADGHERYWVSQSGPQTKEEREAFWDSCRRQAGAGLLIDTCWEDEEGPPPSGAVLIWQRP